MTDQAREVLRLLKEEHNVLISGAPGTGKTLLLTEIANAFRSPVGPMYDPGDPVVIPNAEGASDWMPSPDRGQRVVFRTVFDPKTKYRDFLRGLVPAVTAEGDTGLRFKVSSGTLYRASEHAKMPDGAALVIIDEVNRGPAVHIFGDSIVAIESDKRLGLDGELVADQTQTFELIGDDGEPVDYALPHHLYLVAAMNQADTSVEPLDVAFQRRWAPFRLDPDRAVLDGHFGLTAPTDTLPEQPAGAPDVYAAAVGAWAAVNKRIALGRGRDFQLGHGVMMNQGEAPPDATPAEAIAYVRKGWRKIRAHVDEVFFGDTRGVAAALNVGVTPRHPYTLHRRTFAGEPVVELEEPPLTDDRLYGLLRAVASGE